MLSVNEKTFCSWVPWGVPGAANTVPGIRRAIDCSVHSHIQLNFDTLEK